MKWPRACLALAALALGLGAAPASEPVTLIQGGRLFDGTGASAKQRDVLIEDGRIAAVGRRLRAPPGARTIDARGMTIIPGLHDLHIHTPSAAFETVETLEQGYSAYLAHGVTSVNEYSVSAAMLPGIRALTEAGARTPRLQLAVRLGVPHGHGTESTWTNSVTLQVTTPDAAHAAMARVLPTRPNAIKVFSDGWRYGRDTDRPDMDLPTLAAIVGDAHRVGIPVVTHTVTLAGAKMAAEARVDAIVHGIGDALVDRPLIRLMKKNGTAYVPTLVVYEPQQDRSFLPQEWARLRPREQEREEKRRASPPAAIAAYDSRRWTIMQENVRRLKAAKVEIGVGTDTGIGGVYQGSATIREIVLLTRLGFKPAEALKAATSTSAGIMGWGARQGRIARGLSADLVLVGGRPDSRIEHLYDVRRVFVAGREMPLRPEAAASR